MHRRIAAGVVAGVFLIGSAGTALLLPRLVDAADPTASPSATSTSPATAPAAGQDDPGTPADHAGRCGPGGLDADDLTAAATTLGMTEADLTTALQGGKTLADVAKDKGVDLQKVIDAIVAADKAEIAAAVKAGTMTQAQADNRLANLSAHVTDEVNGVAGGPGHRGGPGGHGPGVGAPSAAPSTGASGTSG